MVGSEFTAVPAPLHHRRTCFISSNSCGEACVRGELGVSVFFAICFFAVGSASTTPHPPHPFYAVLTSAADTTTLPKPSRAVTMTASFIFIEWGRVIKKIPGQKFLLETFAHFHSLCNCE